MLPDNRGRGFGKGPFVLGRVLIADDNVDLVGIWKEILEAEGHDVETAHEGLSVRRQVENGAYDVVVLDIQMPQGEVAKVDDLAGVAANDPKFVIVSGSFTSLGTDGPGVPTGADACLAKPVDLDELVHIVNRLA